MLDQILRDVYTGLMIVIFLSGPLGWLAEEIDHRRRIRRN